MAKKGMAKQGMAKKKSTKSTEQPIPFEQSLENLKAIVHELEDGNLSLDESLERYEVGIRNLKLCYQSLKNAEQKIGLLVALDEQGRVKTRAFDDAATYVEPTSAADSSPNGDEDPDEIDDSECLF